MTTVNLNADMGESYGAFHIGNDEAMIRFVQSVSIACGFHAGDPTIMAETARVAKDHGVSVGAAFISENAVITRTGKKISTPIRTFCTHGDEPTGVEVVRAVRESLEDNGISMVPLPQLAF